MTRNDKLLFAGCILIVFGWTFSAVSVYSYWKGTEA